MGRHIIFKCPQTGMSVQHWLAEAPDQPESAQTTAVCNACTRLHFINSKTGKLLGEADR